MERREEESKETTMHVNDGMDQLASWRNHNTTHTSMACMHSSIDRSTMGAILFFLGENWLVLHLYIWNFLRTSISPFFFPLAGGWMGHCYVGR